MIWIDTETGTWGDADSLVIVEDYFGTPATGHPSDIACFGWSNGDSLQDYIRETAEEMIEDVPT